MAMQMEMPAMGRSPVASIMFSDENKTCLAKKKKLSAKVMPRWGD